MKAYYARLSTEEQKAERQSGGDRFVPMAIGTGMIHFEHAVTRLASFFYAKLVNTRTIFARTLGGMLTTLLSITPDS